MPSTSPPQKRLMAAAAHTPGGFGGVPQSVGKEFNQADKGKKFNKGGPVSKDPEPSNATAFKANLAEALIMPGPASGFKKGGPVGKSGWRRWGQS